MAHEKKLFDRQFDYLICVDSDGCAMDTMDSKHHLCFGPLAAATWELPDADNALIDWNQINLYSSTRGINRFKGLLLFLEQQQRKGTCVRELADLQSWCTQAAELSNRSLEQAVAANPQSDCLKKALAWSIAVNQAIGTLPVGGPFASVAQTLADIARIADIAVVSSANAEALKEEWEQCGLHKSVRRLMSQNDGSKAACIARLLRMGYAPKHVLMVGDAPGDCAAAQENHVHFFPILVQQEVRSWERLHTEALPRFLSGSFDRDYQQLLHTQFTKHLSR